MEDPRRRIVGGQGGVGERPRLQARESALADPDLDLGVHLTLNSKKRHYGWRPPTAPSQAAGLTDEFGFLRPDEATTRRKAEPGTAMTNGRMK